MPFTTHAAKRAAERHGLTPSEPEWSRCVLDIIESCAGDAKSAVLLRRFSDGIERWLVRLCGEPVIAVYNPKYALIITITPAKPRGPFPRGAISRSERGRGPYERARIDDWEC